MVTRGQGGGIGFAWANPARYNGVTIMLGPVLIDIQPPYTQAALDAFDKKPEI
jgi:hypothetical protein